MAFSRPRSIRWQTVMLAVLLVAASAYNVHVVAYRHAPGCPAYRPTAGLALIAHGGGGMSDRLYPNNIAALDRSYAHGLRIFEMDFHELGFGIIRTGHDTSDLFDPRGAWMSGILAWFRRHPDTRLITDMKTDNVHALTSVAAEAPDLRNRIMPFIYQESEYAAVRALGFRPPIFLIQRNDTHDWRSFANSHRFSAIALPYQRAQEADLARAPVVLYTLDTRPTAPRIAGVITNCLVPR